MESNKRKADAVQAGDWVILRFSDGYEKLLAIHPTAQVSFSKIGTHPGSCLIGCWFGCSYEFGEGDQLRLVHFDLDTEAALHAGDVIEPINTNKELFDDHENQTLTADEIETMKESGASGTDIVKKLISNSKTFESKTEFSQAKYIRKKKTKYLKVFTIVKPTIKILCDFYFTKNPAKTRELRIDALSLILTLSNVHSGSRVIVADDCHGLLIASVLQRLGGRGRLIAFHCGEVPPLETSHFLNMPSTFLEPLTTISWGRITEDFDSGIEDHKKMIETLKSNPSGISSVHLPGMVAHQEKKIAELEGLQNAKKEIQTSLFDSLIVGTRLPPLDVLNHLLPCLGSSMPFVFHSPYSDELAHCYSFLKERRAAVNLRLNESWTRQYQVLPGRTHPRMTMYGTSGFLLSGLTSENVHAADKMSRRIFPAALALTVPPSQADMGTDSQSLSNTPSSSNHD